MAGPTHIRREPGCRRPEGKWPALKQRHPGIELHLVGSLQSKQGEGGGWPVRRHPIRFDRRALPARSPRRIQARAENRRCSSKSIPGAEAQKSGRCSRKKPTRFLADCRDRNHLGDRRAECAFLRPIERPAPHFALTAKIAAAQTASCCLSMGNEPPTSPSPSNSAPPMCGSGQRFLAHETGPYPEAVIAAFLGGRPVTPFEAGHPHKTSFTQSAQALAACRTED